MGHPGSTWETGCRGRFYPLASLPSLTGLGSSFCCSPRTYVRGYYLSPLGSWGGALRSAASTEEAPNSGHHRATPGSFLDS